MSSIVQLLLKFQTEQGGYLTAEALQEFSDRHNVPLYRLEELTSFFNSFRRMPPPQVQVQVCRDFACHLAGSKSILADLEHEFRGEIQAGRVELEGKSCIGECDGAIAAIINHQQVRVCSSRSLSEQIRTVLAGQRLSPSPPSGQSPETWKINPYGSQANYDAFRKLMSEPNRSATGDRVIKDLKEATLVGKGGPGQTTYRKWETVRKYAQDREYRYVVCNGDESEPGTFKDRELLLHTPHLVIEGMLIAAMVIGAQKAVVYVRHEYHDQIHSLEAAIRRAYEMNICGKKILGTDFSCDVEVFVSPGNYICGEQTALIEAMEDKRAQPRQRPPDLEIQGYKGWPTLINNVETFAWVPSIMTHGPDWYGGLGKNGARGCRFTSISGDVNRPGVYEVPLGSTVGDLLELAGGMKGDQGLQAFAPSGPSGGFLPPRIPRDLLPAEYMQTALKEDETHFDLLNLPLDNNFFRNTLKGRFALGAAHLFVGTRSNLLSLVKSCTEFYRNESCGKCVPCRLGSEKLIQITDASIAQGKIDFPYYFQDLAELMKMGSICGLGQVAAAPLASIRQFFPELTTTQV